MGSRVSHFMTMSHPPAASTQVARQAYQTTHIACHKRETLTGANTAAFRSGDKRGVYCWEEQDDSYKRPLGQGQDR